MQNDAENAELKAQIEQLRGEVADLRDGAALRGSKAEALFALEYDSLPDWYKSPRAISIYKRINGLIVYVLIAAIALIVFLFWRGPSHDAAADLPKISLTHVDLSKGLPN